MASAPPRIERWASLTGGERADRIRECVEYVLSNYPNSRNSDLYLTVLALRYCTPLGRYIQIIPYELIREFDGILEAIRRTRQKLNEAGLYLPTDPGVLERRRRKAEKIRKAVVRE
jgi:hypothetical protein